MDRDDELQHLLEQLDPTTRTLVAEADLGNEVREFLHTQIGKYIVGCCQQEIVDAQDALSNTSPWRFWKVQELQNRVWRAHSLLNWLRDLLVSGKAAEGAIAEGEE